MSIETILESVPMDFTILASAQVTTALLDKTVTITGAVWPVSVIAGSLIAWTADNGTTQYGIVASITDPTNLELTFDAVAISSGGAGNYFFSIGAYPDYFQATESFGRVPVNQGLLNVNDIMQTPSGKNNISTNEGILIKSVYVRLPYQFTFADTFIDLELGSRNGTSGAFAFLTQIGEGDGIIHVPIENTEIPVNIYIPPNTSGLPPALTWQVNARIKHASAFKPNGTAFPASTLESLVTVSTISMPSVLESQILPVIVGMRILHAATALT